MRICLVINSHEGVKFGSNLSLLINIHIHLVKHESGRNYLDIWLGGLGGKLPVESSHKFLEFIHSRINLHSQNHEYFPLSTRHSDIFGKISSMHLKKF